MFDEHKELAGCVHIATDITEARQREAALRESETRFRDVVECSSDWIWEIDAKGRYTLAAGWGKKTILGYEWEEMIGKSVFDFMPPDEQRRTRAGFAKLAKAKQPIRDVEQTVLKKDGTPVFILTNGVPLLDAEGALTGYRGVSKDITRHRHMEDKLKANEMRYRTLFESSTDAIMILSQGLFVDANEAGFKMFGCSTRDEFLGKSPGEFSPPTQPDGTDSARAANRHAENALRSGSDFFQWLHRRLDGTTFPAEVKLSRLELEGKVFLQALVRDITEREAAERRIKKLYSLQTAIRYINEALLNVENPQRLFEEVCQFMAKVELVTFCWIGVADGATGAITPAACAGREDGYFSAIRFRVGDETLSGGPAGRALRSGQPVIIRDIETDPSAAPWREEALTRGYASALAVPLADEAEAVGVIAIYSGEKDAFGDEEVAFLTEVAVDIVVGLRTLRLQKEREKSLADLRKAFQTTAQSLAVALEKRDPYTSGHAERVTRLACAIAGEMGLPQEQIAGLAMGGILHDIGKIYVPAEILSKPGKLTPLEFEMIKTHSTVGHEILKDIEFPWPVAQMALQHHERMDGKGYPQGLSGEGILLEARIIAVADVVEAMASHRPYRPSLGVPAALKEISDKKGSLFDPDAVDACLRLFYEKGFKLE